jgi:outer membrane protein TolC
LLLVATAATTALATHPAPAAPYRINGVAAPQVQANPVAAQLLQRLDQLREQLKARARQASLQEALEQSLLNNPKLANSYSQIQASQWNLIAVRRQWYPQLTGASAGPAGSGFGFSGNTTRTLNSNQPGFEPNTTYSNSTQALPALQLSWTFFNPSRGPSINAASESLRSQKLLFDVAARNLVLETQLAYFTLQEQQQLLRAYEDVLATTSSEVRRTEALFNNGTASISDVEQIRTQQYQNLGILISAYAQFVDASAALAQAMALPPGILVIPEDKLAAVGQWELPRADTLRQALALREEIQASLAQSASASWSATSLFNQYWPRFTLGASGSYATLNQAGGLPGSALTSNFQEQTLAGAVGIGFNWSIFDGGINAAQAELSKAQARQLLDQAAVQKLQVTREVEQAYANYQASQLALESSREQAAAALRAATAIRERFNIGFADMTSVVQTLNQAISAANAYARSQREYNSAVANLYRSSSQWPEGALPQLNQRVTQLK